MLDYLINFFKPSTPQQNSHLKIALNYNAKIENLKTTAIRGSTNTQKHQLNEQQTKYGKVWIQKRCFQLRTKRKQQRKIIEKEVFNKEIILNRATLFAIEREIEVLKATNEYIGHYLNDNQTKVVIISKKIDSDYKSLNAKVKRDRPEKCV